MTFLRPVLLALLAVGTGCEGRALVLTSTDGQIAVDPPVDRSGDVDCTGERYVRFPSFLQFVPNGYRAWRDSYGKIRVRVFRNEETPTQSSWTGVDITLSSPLTQREPVPALMLDLARMPPGWDLQVGRYGGSSSVGSAYSTLDTSRGQARGFLRLTPEPDPELSLCLSIPVAQWSEDPPSILEIWVDRIALEMQ